MHTKFVTYPAYLNRLARICCGLVLGVSFLASVGIAQLSHIEAAAQLLSQGHAEEAEHEARLAMGDPTTRPLALAMLGTIRLQQGQYKVSIQFLNQALKLNPHLPGTWTTLGDAYALQDKPDLARKSFEQALKIDPTNNNARYDLAKLEASQHNYQRSLDAARPIVAELRRSDEGLLLLATDYGSLGEKEALAGVIRAWQDLPIPSDESSLQFGQILVKYGMAAEAKGIFEAVESRNAGHTTVTLAGNLGKSYLLMADLDGAERNFQLALTLNPACAACDLGVAEVAEQQKDSEKALAYLLKAKQLEPENPDILFEFGKVCLERNLIDDAVSALSKAAALKPDRDSYVYVLASAYVARDDLPKAESLLRGLLQKHPQDQVLNYAMGTVYYLQGHYTEARSSLEQSLQEEPNQVAASYYLSLTYSHLGQNDRAVALLRNLIESHPQYAPSYVKLGTILVAEHDYAEAQEDLERAIALDPTSAQAHYQLYLLFHLLGKSAESKQQYAEWQKLKTEHSERTHLQLHLLPPN